MDKPKYMKAVEKTETLCSNEHFIEHNEKLQVFFENQQFCDITLISSDEKYKVMAHKMFLASVSKYFLAMFGGSLAESNSNEVKLNQIDGDSLKLILNFIYKGIIEVSANTVESILMASSILELRGLEKLCCFYIKKTIDVSNCLGIADLAQRHNFSELYEAATLFVCENFPVLRHTDEFKLVSIDQLCGLIARDGIRATSEYDVFESIVEWINHAKDDRTQFMAKLLTYLRFPLLSPSFIGKIIEKTGESLDTLRIVNNAFTWHTAPSWRSTIFPREQCKIRNLKDVIVAISGCGNSETDLRVGLYYSGLKEWIYTKWPAIPYSSKSMMFTIVQKKLIIAGGVETDTQFSKRVDCLNLETLEWTEFPDLIVPNNCRKIAMITSNDAVYVSSRTHINKIVEPFTKWMSFQFRPLGTEPTNSRRFHYVASNTFAVYNNLIYYLDDEAAHYYAYNTVDLSHEEKIKRLSHVRVIGVHIIKHLGCDYLIEIMRDKAAAYDLETNRNILLNNISFDVSCSRTALHGKNIILYGANRIYEYIVFTNQMNALPHLPKHIDNVDILLSDINSGMQESNKTD